MPIQYLPGFYYRNQAKRRISTEYLSSVHVLTLGVGGVDQIFKWSNTTVRNEPPHPRAYHTATLINNKIYIFKKSL